MKIKSRHFTEQELIEAVRTSRSISECLRKLGLAKSGSSYNIFKSRISVLGLSIDHFGVSEVNRPYKFFHQRELEEILIENSPHQSTHNLKHRLLKAGLLSYFCSRCDISEWNGETISLHLDHINGVRSDNRLENLRLLCPNCHSQTETYAGKNHKVKRKIHKCVDCAVEIWKGSVRCKKCSLPYSSPAKIEWPSVEELLQMVEETSYVAVGRKLGVSDNAVRKHIRIHSKKSTANGV